MPHKDARHQFNGEKTLEKNIQALKDARDAHQQFNAKERLQRVRLVVDLLNLRRG